MAKGGNKMTDKELERIREEIENWVSLIGKKRTEERLRISIHGLKESDLPSVVYE